MAKKKKKNTSPVSHSNLTDAEEKNALKDPNVFIPNTFVKGERPFRYNNGRTVQLFVL